MDILRPAPLEYAYSGKRCNTILSLEKPTLMHSYELGQRAMALWMRRGGVQYPDEGVLGAELPGGFFYRFTEAEEGKSLWIQRLMGGCSSVTEINRPNDGRRVVVRKYFSLNNGPITDLEKFKVESTLGPKRAKDVAGINTTLYKGFYDTDQSFIEMSLRAQSMGQTLWVDVDFL